MTEFFFFFLVFDNLFYDIDFKKELVLQQPQKRNFFCDFFL